VFTFFVVSVFHSDDLHSDAAKLNRSRRRRAGSVSTEPAKPRFTLDVIKPLGFGVSSVVYKARDNHEERYEKYVAIKFIHPTWKFKNAILEVVRPDHSKTPKAI